MAAVAILIVAGFVAIIKRGPDGDIIGPNPKQIPADQLPECGFTGTTYIPQPCFRPSDSVDL